MHVDCPLLSRVTWVLFYPIGSPHEKVHLQGQSVAVDDDERMFRHDCKALLFTQQVWLCTDITFHTICIGCPSLQMAD